jgi:hypothetical protein
MASYYQKRIADVYAPAAGVRVNPAGVEASMRLQYGTLNHLAAETFTDETRLASVCEQVSPGYLRRVAASFGMIDEFEEWEAAGWGAS